MTNTAPLHVLIADDAARVRANLVRMLSSFPGVKIIAEAQDAQQAVEAAQRLHPDITILDLNMPGGGGLWALEMIKQKRPEAQVIILTNHANPFYRERCLQQGANYFFDKTIEFDRIPEVILSHSAPPT